MVRNRSVIGSKCSLSYGLLDKKTGPQDNSSPDRWTSILTGSDETCERGGSKMRLLRIDSSARKASESIRSSSDETCERGGSKMRLLRIDSSARKASVT